MVRIPEPTIAVHSLSVFAVNNTIISQRVPACQTTSCTLKNASENLLFAVLRYYLPVELVRRAFFSSLLQVRRLAEAASQHSHQWGKVRFYSLCNQFTQLILCNFMQIHVSLCMQPHRQRSTTYDT